METLDVRRVSLAAALWLALLYSLCIVGHMLLGSPAEAGMYRLLGFALPGFDPNRPVSFLLGGGEMLLYGAVGGGLFAAVYNGLPSLRASIPELFPRDPRTGAP